MKIFILKPTEVSCMGHAKLFLCWLAGPAAIGKKRSQEDFFHIGRTNTFSRYRGQKRIQPHPMLYPMLWLLVCVFRGF